MKLRDLVNFVRLLPSMFVLIAKLSCATSIEEDLDRILDMIPRKVRNYHIIKLTFVISVLGKR